MEIVCHSGAFLQKDFVVQEYSVELSGLSHEIAYVIDLKKDKDYMSKSKWNQRETEKDHKTLHKTESSYLKK